MMNPCQLLVCMFLALAAQLAQAGPKIEFWQATSGARVFFVENHTLPILDVQVDFAAGTAREAQGKAGVAQLTGALRDLGAAEWDETHIASQIADLGAEVVGGVDRERAASSRGTLSMT